MDIKFTGVREPTYRQKWFLVNEQRMVMASEQLSNYSSISMFLIKFKTSHHCLKTVVVIIIKVPLAGTRRRMCGNLIDRQTYKTNHETASFCAYQISCWIVNNNWQMHEFQRYYTQWLQILIFKEICATFTNTTFKYQQPHMWNTLNSKQTLCKLHGENFC